MNECMLQAGWLDFFGVNAGGEGADRPRCVDIFHKQKKKQGQPGNSKHLAAVQLAHPEMLVRYS